MKQPMLLLEPWVKGNVCVFRSVCVCTIDEQSKPGELFTVVGFGCLGENWVVCCYINVCVCVCE